MWDASGSKEPPLLYLLHSNMFPSRDACERKVSPIRKSNSQPLYSPNTSAQHDVSASNVTYFTLSFLVQKHSMDKIKIHLRLTIIFSLRSHVKVWRTTLYVNHNIEDKVNFISPALPCMTHTCTNDNFKKKVTLLKTVLTPRLANFLAP